MLCCASGGNKIPSSSVRLSLSRSHFIFPVEDILDENRGLIREPMKMESRVCGFRGVT